MTREEIEARLNEIFYQRRHEIEQELRRLALDGARQVTRLDEVPKAIAQALITAAPSLARHVFEAVAEVFGEES